MHDNETKWEARKATKVDQIMEKENILREGLKSWLSFVKYVKAQNYYKYKKPVYKTQLIIKYSFIKKTDVEVEKGDLFIWLVCSIFLNSISQPVGQDSFGGGRTISQWLYISNILHISYLQLIYNYSYKVTAKVI